MTPRQVFNKDSQGISLSRDEIDIIADDTYCALDYSLLNGPFPEGEPMIAKCGEAAVKYAERVLGKKRFALGEVEIAKSALNSYLYACNVIKGRFVTGEEVVSKDGYVAFYYVFNVVKGRFEAAEEAINNHGYGKAYANFLKVVNAV